MSKPISVTYKNKTYKSIAELSRATNVPASLIKDRLKRGMTIENAVDVPKRIIHRKKHYVFDHLGKKYESTEEMCLAYNQKKATYEKRTQVMKWTKKQALTTPPQKTVPIMLKDVNGTTYKSINEFCKAHGISRCTYYNTVKHNEPIDQMLKRDRIIKKPRHRLPNNFKKIKLAYTHNSIDYYECIHNNQKYILSILEMKKLSITEKENG